MFRKLHASALLALTLANVVSFTAPAKAGSSEIWHLLLKNKGDTWYVSDVHWAANGIVLYTLLITSPQDDQVTIFMAEDCPRHREASFDTTVREWNPWAEEYLPINATTHNYVCAVAKKASPSKR
jgi:hypothetical protein